MTDRHFSIGQTLPPYEVVAYNYATASENRIHSDDVAAQYGFSGGLVPGVGVYGYLTAPVARWLGAAWLEGGTMQGKFLKPVYDGETVTVRGEITALSPLTIKLELFNAARDLRAVGEATMPEDSVLPDAANFPFAPLPAPEARRKAAAEDVPAGMIVGALEKTLSLAEVESGFVQDMRDPLPLYRGANACCHPAWLAAQANEILMANVALGPWIHTSSVSRHYALARDGEALSLRGTVAESMTKRGHDFTTLDLVLFGEDRVIAQIRHTAIIRLRE